MSVLLQLDPSWSVFVALLICLVVALSAAAQPLPATPRPGAGAVAQGLPTASAVMPALPVGPTASQPSAATSLVVGLVHGDVTIAGQTAATPIAVGLPAGSDGHLHTTAHIGDPGMGGFCPARPAGRDGLTTADRERLGHVDFALRPGVQACPAL